jgi:prepilin-type processing-associated H-X9-DG protein
MHRGGVNVAMADASVTFVALDINAGAVGGNPDSVVVATASAGNPKGVWGAMATRDGTDFQ